MVCLVHAANFTPPMKGYEKVFANGAVLREADAIPGAATNPLTLYWNSKTHHSVATTARKPPQPGYEKLMLLGYLCVKPQCGLPPPPPQPAEAVLNGLPGALQDDCQTSSRAFQEPLLPSPLRVRWSSTRGLTVDGYKHNTEPDAISSPTSLQHGNLKITAIGRRASHQLSLRIERVSDGVVLTEATPGFGPAAACGTQCAGYSQMSLALSAPQYAKVYGLGQIENTSAHGGCDGNGTTASALPLARNGIGPIDLAASKFHVSIPWAYSTAGFGFLWNLPGDGSVTVNASGAMAWNVAAQKQLDFWITTTPAPKADVISGSLLPRQLLQGRQQRQCINSTRMRSDTPHRFLGMRLGFGNVGCATGRNRYWKILR